LLVHQTFLCECANFTNWNFNTKGEEEAKLWGI